MTGYIDKEDINGAIPAHGGRRDEAARRYGIPREELLDFSASVNPFAPTGAVMAAIRSAAGEVGHYPEERPAVLAGILAAHLGVFPDEVVLGNGSTEVIYWLAAVLQPRRVLIIEPTFSEYRRACLAAGAECASFSLDEDNGFVFDGSLVEPDGYDLVFLCNPNNPTGCLVSVEEVISLWRRCRAAGAGLVVDEAFIEFAGASASVLSNGVVPGLYVIRSLTKSHSLAGLRLGCMVAAEDFAARLRQRMPPWNINVYARAAGMAIMAESGFMDESRCRIASARAELFNGLAGMPGIEPLPSAANYLLCRLEGISAAALADRLARSGILVRDCRSFDGLGDRYIRVAVRSERDNHQLVSSMRKVINGMEIHGSIHT